MWQDHLELVLLADAFDQLGTQDAVSYPGLREMVEDAYKKESLEKGTGRQEMETALKQGVLRDEKHKGEEQRVMEKG